MVEEPSARQEALLVMSVGAENACQLVYTATAAAIDAGGDAVKCRSTLQGGAAIHRCQATAETDPLAT